MAEEAKASPGKVGACEFPEGSLDLLKKLTDGKPGTRAVDGWKTWPDMYLSNLNETLRERPI